MNYHFFWRFCSSSECSKMQKFELNSFTLVILLLRPVFFSSPLNSQFTSQCLIIINWKLIWLHGEIYCKWPKIVLGMNVVATHSSTLARKIPWVEEPGGLQSIGSQRVGHDWATSLFTFIHWRRKWQPTPVFLLAESQGWGSLVGYSPWGSKESDMIEQLHFTSSSECSKMQKFELNSFTLVILLL